MDRTNINPTVQRGTVQMWEVNWHLSYITKQWVVEPSPRCPWLPVQCSFYYNKWQVEESYFRPKRVKKYKLTHNVETHANNNANKMKKTGRKRIWSLQTQSWENFTAPSLSSQKGNCWDINDTQKLEARLLASAFTLHPLLSIKLEQEREP